MATTLRRSLYVGLGGTGINAILHTKKMFLETYGEIPPMIGFLGIDTDKQAFEKKLDANINGEIVKVELEQYERGRISVADPSKVYEREKNDLLDWVPEKNVGYMRSLENGAGQIRSNGRIGLIINADIIKTAIQNRIHDIRQDIRSDKYNVVANSKDEIHMIFSICGGTGAGSFIDTAYLAKQAAGLIDGNNSAKIIGYALLPEVFKAMQPTGPAMKNVKVNAYGSVLDLDYLMHLDNASNKVNFKFSKTNKLLTNETPFSSVVLVDNKNSNRITYTHVDNLTEMLSVTLFLSAGEFGNSGASVLDNIESAKDVTKVKNKKSWVTYLGASEIIFKGGEIADVYSKRAVKSLIQKILSNNKDAADLANTWINQVKIREHQADDLINLIASNRLKSEMEDVDPENVTQDIQNFYNLIVESDEVFTNKEKTILANVMTELEKFIQSHINEPNSPIISTLNALKNIAEQVKVFRAEMINEEEQLNKSFPTKESQLTTAIKELKKYNSKWMKFGGKKSELQSDVKDMVHQIAITKIDLKRHIVAKNIYDSLLAQLQKEIDKIAEIEIVLRNVDGALDIVIANLQNYTNKKVNLFDIDLGLEFITSLNVKTDEIIVSDFINSLPSRNLYNINNQDAIAVQMENYTRTLPQTRAYEDMTIDDRLRELFDKQDGSFDKILEDAIAKANPLIDIDKQGFLEVNDSIAKQFYVGVYRAGISPIQTTPNFRGKLNATERVDYIPTGMKDRVVLYRLEGPMPAFAVSTIVNSCETEYNMYMDDPQKICPNIDKNLLNAMIMDEHSLMPGDELNIGMKYWALGWIFGYLRRKTGNYYYRRTDVDEKRGDAWVSLQTKRRDEAYIEFRKQIGKLQYMYDAYLQKTIRDNTADARNKVADAQSPVDGRAKYFNEIADCEVNRTTIEGPGYRDIKNLIAQEEGYVFDNLLNTIESYINK
ncbi:MAG: hypothetical protein LBJ72_06380 [Dysgonamonadaceae bacterium]|jgi:hypothetical protein|nr:hypothetical protein [Dysgonamonadaceae bacterium]